MIGIQNALILITLSVGVGFALGYLIRILVAQASKNSIELDIKSMMINAKEKAENITLAAEKQASETLKSAREQIKGREDDIKKTEERLVKKEESIEKRQKQVEEDAENLKQKAQELKLIKEKVDSNYLEQSKELERVANLSKDQARDELFSKIEKENGDVLVSRMYKLETFSEEKLENKAREILTSAVQRLATSVSADLFTTHVPIASEEIKGKIIGKEGRNIKTFERMTGVEVVVDDMPGAIMISSFDPIRRQVARIALERLIADGRIQPAKIEKEVEIAEEEIGRIIKNEGEKAIYETGITQLDPRIIAILGRLHFRTSYGQNVLQHSIECAHIAGMLAEELGANVMIAKAGALVHDIGKALDHEVQGTHVEIGRRILEKFGASEQIIKAMQAHHEEYPYETLESRIVQTADAISGGRPGARKENIEHYVKRLEDLEKIAFSQKGVEKAYALQAGREVRVFVFSDQVSDLDAQNMARNIAKMIEDELRYPGEIKVNVIRESRAIEFAR